MAPPRLQKTLDTGTVDEPVVGRGKVQGLEAVPSLDELRGLISPAAFEVSAATSLLYFFAYASLLATAFWVHPYCVGVFSCSVYTLVYGTLMWAFFVVGHDAGHGTFSKSPTLNALVGHLAHGPLLVPFWPWALSHHHHHKGHNHVTNDFSHLWLTPEAKRSLSPLAEAFAENNVALLLLTPIHFAMYLYPGVGDGSHIFPWGLLWERTSASTQDRLRGVVSTLVVVACLGLLRASGMPLWAYLAPWLVYNSWLFIVTYMQHHREGIEVYGDKSWTFVRGAFQTVDRVMGLHSDWVTLYITSDHLVHHLFAWSIPHYNLRRATEDLRAGLESKGLSHLHKRVVYSSPLHYLAHLSQTLVHGGFTDFQLIE